MTTKFDSEQDLFSAEEKKEEGKEKREGKSKDKKRLSLGPRLPVKMSGEHSRSVSASDSNPGDPTPGPTTATGGGFGGSVLGGATTLGESANGLIVRLPMQDGSTISANIWSDVISGTKAKSMHEFIKLACKSKEIAMESFIEGIMYQGFNRDFYIQHALKTLSISMFSRFAVLGAVRGSNFTKILDTCEDMPADLIAVHNSGRILRKPKKRTDLTILRFTASIPQWCAYWMHSASVEKKISSQDCPAFLQFPAAASIPMSEDLRKQHIRFCINFSKLLPGGDFKISIYCTAYSNLIPMNQVPEAMRLALGVSTLADARTMSVEDVTTFAANSSRRSDI